jgi:hypothetical protein
VPALSATSSNVSTLHLPNTALTMGWRPAGATEEAVREGVQTTVVGEVELMSSLGRPDLGSPLGRSVRQGGGGGGGRKSRSHEGARRRRVGPKPGEANTVGDGTEATHH